MSTKNYGKWVCNRCGKQVSLCGLAQYQHAQWHKRQTAKSSGVAQRSTSPNTTKVQICPECEGFGYTEPTLQDPDGLCPKCRGAGKL